MSLRKLIVGVSALSILLVASVASFGQIGKVSGRVYKKDADGKPQSVAGVKITCYRTDTDQKCRDAETDSRGEFIILGIPIGGRFILGVSGPDLEPTFVPETVVGAASENLDISVAEGDGREATEEQVRLSAATLVSGDLTDEQKKAQAEIEKKRLEIIEKNKKAEANNARRDELLKSGDMAFKAGTEASKAGSAALKEKDREKSVAEFKVAVEKFDSAVQKFEEGYKMDPDFVGAAPVFLNNLSVSLQQRAISVYNVAAATGLKAEIDAGKEKAAGDFLDSLSYALKSIEIGSAETIEETKKKNLENSEKSVKETFRVIGLMGLNLLQYVSTDEDIATTVRVFKASFEMMPKDSDILASLVFAVYSAGDAQQSLNYATHYLKTADKAHSQQVGIKDLADLMTCTGAYKPVKGDPNTECTPLTPQPLN